MPRYIGYYPTGTANSSVTRVVYNLDFPVSGTPAALPTTPIPSSGRYAPA